ncbi:uncharacterized protein LOC110855947 [Folsomia candida]|uniref:Uncharacterized protein n=1 Tax=Folsomia candida TaxID=158441 RepID=A0A226DR52_FOLCA|nr:uncharacterized protein LOC110855947 [Folsomia candida]XP_021960073.1 uncharacterized protein LOC110855947 [Folsomia candida]OXA46686.1 hypothetical protein Fcan01_18219 [Folsomia candida]
MTSARRAFFNTWDKDCSTLEEMFKPVNQRFPGPAGLLPVLRPDEAPLLQNPSSDLRKQISNIISAGVRLSKNNSSPSKWSDTVSESTLGGKKTRNLSPPGRNQEVYKMDKRPWRELVKHLHLNPNDPDGILNKMNVDWLKNASLTIETKIPFLALVVKEEPEVLAEKQALSGKQKNPSLRLMDCSGSIVAALDSAFVEEYASELSAGTGIAVKNARFIPLRAQVILVVNKSNIICVTSLKKPEKVVPCEKKIKFVSRKSTPISRTNDHSPGSGDENTPKITENKDGIRLLVFSDFCSQTALQEFENIQMIAATKKNTQQPSLLFGAQNSTNLPRFTPPTPLSRPFSANSVLPTPPATQDDDFSSMFGDEDDEDLLLALEAVDFLRDDDSK